MTEEWRPVTFNTNYEVSNFGRVRSMDRLIHRQRMGNDTEPYFKKGRIIITPLDKQGYPTVSIKHKSWKVHRVVMLAFKENPEDKKCINHIDGVKRNNHVSNLEWVTHSENIKHAHRTGLKKPQQTGKSGYLHHRSREVISINQTAIIQHGSIREAARYFGVHERAISLAAERGFNCRGNKIYYA